MLLDPSMQANLKLFYIWHRRQTNNTYYIFYTFHIFFTFEKKNCYSPVVHYASINNGVREKTPFKSSSKISRPMNVLKAHLTFPDLREIDEWLA